MQCYKWQGERDHDMRVQQLDVDKNKLKLFKNKTVRNIVGKVLVSMDKRKHIKVKMDVYIIMKKKRNTCYSTFDVSMHHVKYFIYICVCQVCFFSIKFFFVFLLIPSGLRYNINTNLFALPNVSLHYNLLY